MFRNFISTHYNILYSDYKKPFGLFVSGIGLLTGSYYYNYNNYNLILLKKHNQYTFNKHMV